MQMLSEHIYYFKKYVEMNLSKILLPSGLSFFVQ